jgi:hypothetical protein
MSARLWDQASGAAGVPRPPGEHRQQSIPRAARTTAHATAPLIYPPSCQFVE